MAYTENCPRCGEVVTRYRNPFPTVDVVIEMQGGRIVLVRRRNPPHGWALPGGFVDYGESVEDAAVREAREETGLEVRLLALIGVYSRPDRDPRKHTLSIAFIAAAQDEARLRAGDDAGETALFPTGDLPELAFDHRDILQDYVRIRQGERGLSVGAGRSVCGRDEGRFIF
jgi:8-oxo-dGTP diphosphatase